MRLAAAINIFIYGGLLIVGLLSWFVWDKRYHRGHGVNTPNGYEATTEIFIDPVSGKKLRVYYNPETGDRFYREE